LPSDKSARVSERKGSRNRPLRSSARTSVKKAEEAIEEGNFKLAQDSTKEALKLLDQASSKGIIHKNNAARRKSKLVSKLNQIDLIENT